MLILTKFFLQSLSPGLVNTNLINKDPSQAEFKKLPLIQPDDIAESILYILGTHPRVQITEMTIRPLGEIL